MRINVEVGNIVQQRVDAIVNAANPAMLGGGGVDGAIHAAAGPKLLAACRKVAADGLGVRCPTGEARITPAFDLPAKHVIHAVGPVFRSSLEPERLLASAYRQCLELAEAHGVRSIAFPAISCGSYGYPLEAAAAIALRVARERPWEVDEIRFVLFDERTARVFRAALLQA